MFQKLTILINQWRKNRTIIRNYKRLESEGKVEGFDDESNSCWIDTLTTYKGNVVINRDWLSRDGDHLNVEDVTEAYEE